ncbi:hypothetical protein ACH439_22855 [Streptomyces microflavus]|uniref:hypothetical protein n=1 Tax=Streptomyces microflavus TaxID=1919 RepID=UPI00378E95AA
MREDRTAGAPTPVTVGRTGIWVGDLARALTRLGVDPDDGEKVGRVVTLLGLRGSVSDLEPAPEWRGAPAPVAEEERRAAPPASPRGADAAAPPNSAEPLPPTADGTAGPLPLLSPLTGESDIRSAWRFPALAERGDGPAEAEPAHHTLLPPNSETATLQTVLSRTVREGEIDTHRLLEEFATGRPLQNLPRLPVRTLRFGTQVLIDLGPGMEMFARDQDELVNRITVIVGRHATEVLYFAGSPLNYAGPGAGWTWRPYRPPAAGTRVLILSGFGCNLPGSGTAPTLWQEWQELTGLLRRSGCRPAALVPLPPDRFPAPLTSLMPVVSWDRSTTTVQAESRVP